MAKRDYYDLLGVSKSADEAQLKKAFKKKVMELHPDRNQDNPNAEAQFKEVNEAYDVLKDAEKKAAYDRYGHAAFEGGHGASFRCIRRSVRRFRRRATRRSRSSANHTRFGPALQHARLAR